MTDPPDFLGSIERLQEAVDQLDSRAPSVLAYHAAIERELDLAIGRSLPKPGRLSGLSFGHKVRVWAALQNAPDETVELVVLPLLRFNDLRNAIAHGDRKHEVDANMQNLLISVPEITTIDPDLSYIAAFIFGSLNSKLFSSDLLVA